VTEQVLQGARAKGLSNDVRRDQRFARWVWERTWARERGRFLEWFTFLSYAGASCGRVTRSELICGAAAPPLHIRYPVETGECYVWVQARVREPTLGTTLKPDFSLTRTRAKPAPLNLLGTIECKSTDNCRTELVREVYSKMRLLEISHTRMVVDGKLSKASAGACRLGGIDVDEHVFDPSVIRGMDARGDCYVFDKLAVGLEESARQRNFAERRDERERQRREGRRSPSRVDHV
jgi:hypothetical protein